MQSPGLIPVESVSQEERAARVGPAGGHLIAAGTGFWA
jgi:hypothetical protein